jgi:hypothetical protein
MTNLEIIHCVMCPWEKAEHRDPVVNIKHCYNCQFYLAHFTNLTFLTCQFPEQEGDAK